MKKTIFFIIVVYSCLLTACSISGGPTANNSSETDNASITNTSAQSEDIVLTAHSAAEFTVIYKTNEERFIDPDVVAVIEGEVISNDYVYIDHLLYTQSIIRVNTVFKGDIEAEDTICVVERGGYVPYEVFYIMEIQDKWPDAPVPKETGIIEDLGYGCKVMQPSERIILYLVKGNKLKEACIVTDTDVPHQRGNCHEYSSDNIITTVLTEGQFYGLAGAAQGKMVFQNGVYKMQLPPDFVSISQVESKDFSMQEFKTFVETVKKGK